METHFPTLPEHQVLQKKNFENPNTFQTPVPLNISLATMTKPPTRMELIVAARYAPLVLPQHLNALPQGDYLKYLPKFTDEVMELRLRIT